MMSEQEQKSTDGRAARGEDPPTSRRKERIEIWRPGYIGEIAEISGDETLERSQTTEGKRAVRAPIKPMPKDQGGD
jgi:hypothetical protein